jgi:hypothetical protein
MLLCYRYCAHGHHFIHQARASGNCPRVSELHSAWKFSKVL